MRVKSFICLLAFAALALSLSVPLAAAGEKSQNTVVVVKTNLGQFNIELYDKKAPITVKNFLEYVDQKFYDGTIFHRVIPNFMIQGGGFTPDMMKKAARPPIKNEADNGLENLKGSLAMARTAEVNSATCQFFINVKDNKVLDHGVRDFGYAVFGKVVEGWDVVEKIKNIKTTVKDRYRDVPAKPVIIESMRRVAVGEKKTKEKAKE